MITHLGGGAAGDDCLPVHDGQAALVLVHAEQREHGEVVLVQHHRVLNLAVVPIIVKLRQGSGKDRQGVARDGP